MERVCHLAPARDVLRRVEGRRCDVAGAAFGHVAGLSDDQTRSRASLIVLNHVLRNRAIGIAPLARERRKDDAVLNLEPAELARLEESVEIWCR